MCLDTDLAEFCVKEKAVFPGLETFEMGIKIPIFYVLFYDFFYKCSVGDTRWKKSCLEEKDKTAPLGAPQAEAFAMMQLRNNYFAWLFERKEESKGKLITDYDPEKDRRNMKNAAEAYLKKLELDLDDKEEEDKPIVI